MNQPEHAPSSGAGTLGHYSDTEWDITTGVGYTALAVAAGRAMETHRPDGLINDPQADRFIAAAQDSADGTAIPLPTGWPPEPTSDTNAVDADEMQQIWAAMATYMGVRSRFFDHELQQACHEDGVRQVVLLAAGLDTRAHRLSWPSGTQLFEIDHPNVLAFKDRVLDGQDTQTRGARHAVGVDLREDWPAMLRQAGFNPQAPTAWLAEGLFPFLPDEAKHRLCQRVQQLSAPGSRWAIESLTDPAAAMATLLHDDTVLHRLAAQFGADPSGLWPTEQHWQPHTWLVQQGWTSTTASAHTVAARYHRTLDGPAPIADPRHPSMLISATYEHPPHPNPEGNHDPQDDRRQ